MNRSVSRSRKNKRAVGSAGAHGSRMLTPLVDIAFLLLVGLVVSVGFANGEGILTAKFPAACGGCPGPQVNTPTRPMTVHIETRGEADYGLRINDGTARPARFADLRERLTAWRGTVFRDDNPVIIKPEHGVRWTHVVNAFHTAQRAGYRNIAFAQVAPPDEND